MAQQRRRQSKPSRSAPQRRSSGGSGVRASGSVNVAPKFTLFGGSLLNFSFGGRQAGGRGRSGGRSGGGLKRAMNWLGRGVKELGGKGATAGKVGAAGMRGKSDRSGFGPSSGDFDRFRESRPDLFGGGHGPEYTGDAQVVDEEVVDAELVDDVPPDPGPPWLRRQIEPPGGAR